jgi:8-oxo-dGTP pyrophosphatase MutT (NUDIX family)
VDHQTHVARKKALRPRDAATLIIVDRESAPPRVLMGRRRPDQVFLPNKHVFPGGRVEPADRHLARRYGLAPSEEALLLLGMKGTGSAARAAALALAALRETFEETGLIVGVPRDEREAPASGGWAEFMAEGFMPRLDRLTYLARAITPPGRPRRYDTRFFITDAATIAHRSAHADGELLDATWIGIDAAQELDLPSITRAVLGDIKTFLAHPSDRAPRPPVPFYFHRHGRFERTLVERTF